MTPLIGGVVGAAQSAAQQKVQVEQQYQQQLGVYNQQVVDYNHQLAQIEVAKRRTDDEARVRDAEFFLKNQQLQLAEQEANASAAQQKSETAREIQRAQALAKLSALEGNAGGNTAQRMAVDMGFTLGQKFGAIETTRSSAIDQNQSEKYAAQLSAYTQPLYYTTPNEPVKPTKGNVNYAAAALGGVSGFIGNSGNLLSGVGTATKTSTCTPRTVTNPCGTSSRFQ